MSWDSRCRLPWIFGLGFEDDLTYPPVLFECFVKCGRVRRRSYYLRLWVSTPPFDALTLQVSHHPLGLLLWISYSDLTSRGVVSASAIFCLFVHLRIIYCLLCFGTAIDPAMDFSSRIDFVIFTVLPATQRTCRFGSWEETKVCFVLHSQLQLDNHLRYWYFFSIVTRVRDVCSESNAALQSVFRPCTACLVGRN